MVLGYTFLLKHQLDIDWKTRTLRFLRIRKEHFVNGIPGPLPAELLSRVSVIPMTEDSNSTSVSSAVSTATENGSHTGVPPLPTQRKEELCIPT